MKIDLKDIEIRSRYLRIGATVFEVLLGPDILATCGTYQEARAEAKRIVAISGTDDDPFDTWTKK